MCPSKRYCPLSSSLPLSCPAGSYCPTGVTAPLPCLPGQYAPAGNSSSCTFCRAGSACGLTGLSVETPCAAGSYTPSTGYSACLPCPSGRVCASTGISVSVPSACSAGFFSPSPGYSTCLPCVAGSFCARAVTSIPTICPIGSFCPVVGLIAPVPCSRGAFCPIVGLTVNQSCPAGAYCSQTGLFAPMTCPLGTYCGTSGLTAARLCPNGTLPSSDTLTCDVCPSDFLCLLGASAPFSFSRLLDHATARPTQDAVTPLAPINIISVAASSLFAVLQRNLAYASAAVVAVGFLVGVHVHYYRIVFSDSIVALDLFRLAHFTPSGKSVTAYKTSLGVVFTFTMVVVIGLVSALIVAQSTVRFSPVTTLSTGLVPFEPTGLFAFSVAVVGFGLAQPCTNGAMNLTLDFPNSFLGVASTDGTMVAPSSTSVYFPDQSACRVTWQCLRCRLSSGSTLPIFRLQTTNASWANLYAFNFTVPSFTTDDGTLYDPTRASSSVSQVIFPTDTPADMVAFRSVYATQRLTLLLTGSSLIDEPRGTNYTAYQPFIAAVDKSVLPPVPQPNTYMSPSSPLDLDGGGGFAVTIVLQRNTVQACRYFNQDGHTTHSL
jgi:hypothetical protein